MTKLRLEISGNESGGLSDHEAQLRQQAAFEGLSPIEIDVTTQPFQAGGCH
jgi:hypothetical protein